VTCTDASSAPVRRQRPRWPSAVSRLGARTGLLAAALLATLGGCRTRIPDDELVVLIETAAQTIDPRYCVGAYDFKLSRLAYAPLVSVDDESIEPKMELAESVRPDGDDRWLVALRDAQFSDGRRVTAADVTYTIEQLRDPVLGSPRMRDRFTADGLERVEIVDDRHLVFHLSHPHAPFITDLDFGIFARPAGAVPLGRDTLPVGAGAFIFVAREGETFRFVCNPHYFGGIPRVRALTVRTIRDDNSRLLALVGGSADLTQNTISPLLVPAVEAQPQLRVVTARSSVYSYLGLNQEDPILKDVRVRRAIAMAIDRAQIVRTKLRGRAVLATGMLPTFHWAYAGPPLVTDPPFDPAAARKLLDEAGYPDPDGDGPLPRMTLVYKTSSNKFRVAMARVIVAMLADVGIAVDLRANEFATFFADIKAGNYQMFSMQIPEIAEPDLYTHFFASSRIPTRERPDAGGNRVRYRNPEVDRLLDQGRRELDRDRRRALYAEVQKILSEDLPVISLWHEDNVVAMRKEVTGYTLLPTAQFSGLARVAKSKAALDSKP
jgi:peptide/nickel transport system substrate-binding protein